MKKILPLDPQLLAGGGVINGFQYFGKEKLMEFTLASNDVAVNINIVSKGI